MKFNIMLNVKLWDYLSLMIFRFFYSVHKFKSDIFSWEPTPDSLHHSHSAFRCFLKTLKYLTKMMLSKSCYWYSYQYIFSGMLSIPINKTWIFILLVSAKIIYRDTNSNIKTINHESQYSTAACNLRVACIWIQTLWFLNVHTLASHQKFRVSEAASCQMIEHWCFENELLRKAGKLAKLGKYIK